MKKMRKILVSMLTILAITLTSVSALAYTEQEAPQEKITEFYYSVYNKDGEIVETGTIPGSDSRVKWEGIVLDNGEEVKLTKANGQAFNMLADVRYDFVVWLDRKARMYNAIYRSNYDASENLSLTDSWYSNVLTYSRAATMPEAGYYYFMIKNYSSDPVTIEEVELIF